MRRTIKLVSETIYPLSASVTLRGSIEKPSGQGAHNMETYYSNVVNVRVTPNELVFEFSMFFPDRPNVVPPADLKPEARIVMSVAALEQLAGNLTAVLAQKRAAEAKQTGTPSTGLGFTSQPPKA